MKKILLFFYLLLSIKSACFGQKIRFTDTTNIWSVADGFIGPPSEVYYFQFQYSGDSVIDSVHYQALIAFPYTHYCFIREDTVKRKIWIRGTFDFDTMSRELLLMDYNLKVGDSISHFYYRDSFICVVNSIDSVLINSVWHKVWEMKYVHGNVLFEVGGYYVIEGIGSDGGPLYPLDPLEFENYWVLYCFSNNNSHPLVSPSQGRYGFNNTSSCHLQVENLSSKHAQIYIVPNPANNTSKIVFPLAIQSGAIRIYNAFGQLVRQESFSNHSQYFIGFLGASGLYYYQVIDANLNQRFTGKFVYE
jgi:hypothetical protein